MNKDIKDIIVTVLLSGAFYSFLQFLITRFDNKRGMEKQIKQLFDQRTEDRAVLARTHILRFADELRNGIQHSEDYFRQQLLDCDTYEHYCNEHPDFANGLTKMSTEYIREEYKQQYLNNDTN